MGSGLDMVGPTVGNVLHKQLGNGDLQIGAFVRRSDPNMSYGLQVLCGAVHNTGAVITLDLGSVLTTDANGKGNVSFVLSAAQLAVCGSGSHTAHLDFFNNNPGGSWLTATGLNFLVP